MAQSSDGQAPMTDLSHFDEHGQSRMVDVGGKPVSERIARASGSVRMAPATVTLIRDRNLAKGDVLEVARLAGIMAAKRTSELIPLCHPLPLDAVTIDFDFPDDATLSIIAEAARHGPHGGRDGSAHRRERRRLDGLRHVQGDRPQHDDRRDPARREIRRPQRTLARGM